MRLLDDYKIPVFEGTVHDSPRDDASSSVQLTPTTPQFSNSYTRLASAPTSPTIDMYRLQAHDRALKQRIRMLKLVSRILAVILSIATLIPLMMTIIKFLTTRDITYTVDGQTRTAWAKKHHHRVYLLICCGHCGIAHFQCDGPARILLQRWDPVCESSGKDGDDVDLVGDCDGHCDFEHIGQCLPIR